MQHPPQIRSATAAHLPAAAALMAPFVARGELLPRSQAELLELLPLAIVAELDGRVAGFAAIEIYSWKLSEIQCLSFEESPQAPLIARHLVQACVEPARGASVLEVMAVVPAALEELLKNCGFSYSLPDHKRAMFIRPQRASIVPEPLPTGTVGNASLGDLTEIEQFLRHSWPAPNCCRGPAVSWSTCCVTRLWPVPPTRSLVLRLWRSIRPSSRRFSACRCGKDTAARELASNWLPNASQRARQHHVAETMAITSQEEFLLACGFDYCLSGPKMALFLRTRP